MTASGPDFAHARADPAGALQACLDRIDALNPALNAVLDLADARAEAEASARRRASGQALGPLDGVPVLVKANIAVKGLPWHGGVAAYRDRIAERDAAAAARLRAAGAVILGTVNMEEGALGAITDNPHFGRCFNPWADGLTPGGSSGGSGAAVAAGLAPLALGTDTMGSVRIPAAYCGVCGHKPSRGAIPTGGVMALSPTLDCVGPLTRRAEDLASAFAAMAGAAPRRSWPGWDGLRVGRWRFEHAVQIDHEILAAFDAALAMMADQGAKIVDVRLSAYEFGRTRRHGLLVAEREGAREHAQAVKSNPDGFSKDFRAMLEWGAAQSEAKYRAALDAIAACGADAAHAFETCEFLVSPAALETAFPFGAPVPAGQADLTAFAAFAGVPATAVPMGLSTQGRPMGLQIMAPAGADFAAIGAAAAYEALRELFPAPQ